MKNIWEKTKHLKSDYKQISIKSIKTAQNWRISESGGDGV